MPTADNSTLAAAAEFERAQQFAGRRLLVISRRCWTCIMESAVLPGPKTLRVRGMGGGLPCGSVVGQSVDRTAHDPELCSSLTCAGVSGNIAVLASPRLRPGFWKL